MRAGLGIPFPEYKTDQRQGSGFYFDFLPGSKALGCDAREHRDRRSDWDYHIGREICRRRQRGVRRKRRTARSQGRTKSSAPRIPARERRTFSALQDPGGCLPRNSPTPSNSADGWAAVEGTWLAEVKGMTLR
jgi:hypothetical protein